MLKCIKFPSIWTAGKRVPYEFNLIYTSRVVTEIIWIYTRELDELTFHAISDETLHALLEYFEELGDRGYFHQDYDIEYSVSTLYCYSYCS